MSSPLPLGLAALALLANACSASQPGAADAGGPAASDVSATDAGASLDAGQAGPDAAGSPLDASLPGADAGLADPFPEAFGVFAPFTDEILPFPDPAVSVYAYRSRATGKTGLVAWRDGAAAQASLDFAGAAARATSLVTDAAGAPTRDEALAVAAGKVSLSLDASPVWIAEP